MPLSTDLLRDNKKGSSLTSQSQSQSSLLHDIKKPHHAIRKYYRKMTSEGARRLSNKGHQRTSSKSSSTASASAIPTPPASSPSDSSTTGMPTSIDDLRDDMDHTHLNGTAKSSKRGPRAELDRKASTPMMPAFMVSAPGKVIVFGEHAVVHGKARTLITY